MKYADSNGYPTSDLNEATYVASEPGDEPSFWEPYGDWRPYTINNVFLCFAFDVDGIILDEFMVNRLKLDLQPSYYLVCDFRKGKAINIRYEKCGTTKNLTLETK